MPRAPRKSCPSVSSALPPRSGARVSGSERRAGGPRGFRRGERLLVRRRRTSGGEDTASPGVWDGGVSGFFDSAQLCDLRQIISFFGTQFYFL